MINKNIFDGKGEWKSIYQKPKMNSAYFTKMNDDNIILSKYLDEIGWIISDTRYNKDNVIEWFDDTNIK